MNFLAALFKMFLNDFSDLCTLFSCGIREKMFSVYSVKPSQLALETLMNVLFSALTLCVVVFIEIIMGRWSEFRAGSTFQSQVGSKLDDAMDISGDDELLAVTRVGVSSFIMPKGTSPM